jgi:hypothetical protein
MKNIFLLAFLILLTFTGIAQNQFLEASIDNKCNAVPGVLKIDNGKTVFEISIKNLTSGNNCYNGAKFVNRGFNIKNSAGDIIYKYSIDKNGTLYQPQGDINKLQLGMGIYHVYVDGGRGAYLRINYRIKYQK